MRHIVLLFIIFFSSHFMAQEQNNQPKPYFAQSLFQIENQEDMLRIEQLIRQHPNVKVARLDFPTQRAFILFHSETLISASEYRSWFQEYAETISCVQIGLHGVDQVNPFPFNNCH